MFILAGGHLRKLCCAAENQQDVPTNGLMHRSKTASLFNHLVGAAERQRRGMVRRAGSMRHAIEFRDRGEVVDPCLLRANKYLPAWHQLISLAQRSKAQVEGFWLIANRRCIERRPPSLIKIRLEVQGHSSRYVLKRKDCARL
jgi:hypothetical protein